MRIVLADDHPIVLSGLEALLKRAGHEVVGVASAGDQALALVVDLRPDVAILDVNMPGATGLDVLRQLRAGGRDQSVVLIMASLEDRLVIDAMELGVDGLVLKESATDSLLDCLETVAAGQRWIDREALNRAEAAMSRQRYQPRLTPREREIVRLVATGKRNRDIGETLGMSEGTVKAHLRNIFDKMGIETRAELAVTAKDQGLA